MDSKKILTYTLLFLTAFTFLTPLPADAAPGADIAKTLASSTAPTGAGGLFGQLFDLLFNKILGPLLNIFNNNAPANGGNPSPPKLPPVSPPVPDSGAGILSGKVIAVDPGHGGSNPGAVANGGREADNNLAVGLKLRAKLIRAGARVVMTRDTDRTVAPPGSSLGEELQARVDLAAANKADIFVSIHTNDNPNPNITGLMTFYPSGKSSQLAAAIRRGAIQATGAADKGTLPETFQVLRNAPMPSTLVEMGFISNPEEAARLASDSYRDKIAQGIFNGITQYFQNL